MQDHDLNDIFQSKYLKAEDLNGKEWTMVIATAVPQTMGEGAKASMKVFITFQGAKKAFVANKTNCKRIAFRHGNKLSGWIGKEIILYPDLVDFQGEAVEAIRVKHPVAREEPVNGGTPNIPGRIPAHEVEDKGRYDTLRRTEPVKTTGDEVGSDEIPF